MPRMQFERAVSDFTRVIELDSGNANAYFNRGSAYVCPPPLRPLPVSSIPCVLILCSAL